MPQPCRRSGPPSRMAPPFTTSPPERHRPMETPQGVSRPLASPPEGREGRSAGHSRGGGGRPRKRPSVQRKVKTARHLRHWWSPKGICTKALQNHCMPWSYRALGAIRWCAGCTLHAKPRWRSVFLTPEPASPAQVRVIRGLARPPALLAHRGPRTTATCWICTDVHPQGGMLPVTTTMSVLPSNPAAANSRL